MDYELAKAKAEEILNKALEHEIRRFDPDLARRILTLDLAGAILDAHRQGRREVIDEWHEHDRELVAIRRASKDGH